MEAEKVSVREILEVLISKDKINLDYTEIKQHGQLTVANQVCHPCPLHAVKAEYR